MNKIILLVLTILIIAGCKNNEKPIDTDTNLEEKAIIKIKDNLEINTDPTQFVLGGIVENSTLAITTNYENSEVSTGNGQLIPGTSSDADEEKQPTNSDKNNIHINISNELLLDVMYDKQMGEEPKKIEITNLQIKKHPKKGTLKIYAIKEGDNYSYIDFMRNNEINGTTNFTQDILGNKLIDGRMGILFSATIENITKVSFKEYGEKEIKQILEEKNINKNDLSFSIYFEIIITTDNEKYYLSFEYENDGENIINLKQRDYTLNNLVNFIKK